MNAQNKPSAWSDIVDNLEEETVDCPDPPSRPLLLATTPLRLVDVPAPRTGPRKPPDSRRRTALTIGLGIVAFVLALIFASGPGHPLAPIVRPDPRGAPNPMPAAVPVPEVEVAAQPKAAPVLTVMTVPPGAQIEIDGRVHGRTPLVMPSPTSRGLMIRLRHPGFRVWEQVVHPNEAGHFQVKVSLEPAH